MKDSKAGPSSRAIGSFVKRMLSYHSRSVVGYRHVGTQELELVAPQRGAPPGHESGPPPAIFPP